MLTDGRMDKENLKYMCVCVCMYINGILLSHKKEWNLVICDLDYVEGIMLNEICQTDKDKY